MLNVNFNIDISGEPNGTWYLLFSFDIAWLDLYGANQLLHQHVGLVDFGLGDLLLAAGLGPTGSLSFPAALPPDAILLGFPIVVQVVVEHPGTGQFNWSNSTTLIGMPQ